ncbi:MAG: putative lipid II flippase FtsW [Rhodospirillaceae bacterium]|jgi:cell division protein FtsW|nr:putative lipid II flippase FtsW [Rhodospirillaceae bacterium]
MSSFARTDTSVVGRWWWTVDRWSLAALALLIGVGILLVLAASPSVAERIGANSFHFIQRQAIYLPVALVILFAVSLLTPRDIRRLAVLGFLASILLLAVTPWLGAEIKGARRWLSLGALSLQPSEFVKPTFAVVAAWMFAEQRATETFPGNAISIALFGLVVGLLLLQPDFGMTLVVTAVWFTQFFMAGLPMFYVVGLCGLGIGLMIGGYLLLPHVASRVDRFLDPSSGDTYQVSTALEAFMNGGLFGVGPGEGRVKDHLPDAHADFIFAVAGEEFGLLACLGIVMLFAFIVLRGFSRMLQERDLFIVLATVGLLAQFGLQALINMGSNLRLMPAKGMTLPFISYGGSSLLALALGMGMMLALTRRRYGAGRMI